MSSGLGGLACPCTSVDVWDETCHSDGHYTAGVGTGPCGTSGEACLSNCGGMDTFPALGKGGRLAPTTRLYLWVLGMIGKQNRNTQWMNTEAAQGGCWCCFPWAAAAFQEVFWPAGHVPSAAGPTVGAAHGSGAHCCTCCVQRRGHVWGVGHHR